MKFIAILTCVLALSTASIANTKEAAPARTLENIVVAGNVNLNLDLIATDAFEAICAAPVHFLTITRKGTFSETFDSYNRVLRVRFVRPIKVLQNA